MKLKISIIFLLFAMFLTLSACSQSNNDPSNEKITNSPVITESKNKESDVRTFALSDYTYEVEFIDENDILKIKESYDLDNTDSISKIVYVPFIDELNTKETTSKYTIKELESEEKNVDLIYSSQFEAPSGVARIERTMSAKNVFYEKCKHKKRTHFPKGKWVPCYSKYNLIDYLAFAAFAAALLADFLFCHITQSGPAMHTDE